MCLLSLRGLEIVAVRAAAVWRFELLCSFTENRLWDKNDVPSWEPLVKPLTSSRAGKGSWARADFVCSDYQRLRNIWKLGELLANGGTSVGFRGPHATTPSFSSTRVSCKPFLLLLLHLLRTISELAILGLTSFQRHKWLPTKWTLFFWKSLSHWLNSASNIKLPFHDFWS